MIDAQYPSIRNSMRVDSASCDHLFGYSIRNKRNKYTSTTDRLADRVKHVAKEGAMLTLIGKVTYNFETDQFTITDGLGLIGGGLEDSVAFLKIRLATLKEVGWSLISLGLGLISFAALYEIIKHYTKVQVER